MSSSKKPFPFVRVARRSINLTNKTKAELHTLLCLSLDDVDAYKNRFPSAIDRIGVADAKSMLRTLEETAEKIRQELNK